MHRQPGRLVDDQHQSVAVEHARQDFVGGQLGNIEQLVETFVYEPKRLTHPRHERYHRRHTKLSWWRRLSSGLKRTSSSLGTAVADLVTKRKLDRAMLDDIEDVLLRADLGT